MAVPRFRLAIASYHPVCIRPSGVAEHTQGWLAVAQNPLVDVIDPLLGQAVSLVADDHRAAPLAGKPLGRQRAGAQGRCIGGYTRLGQLRQNLLQPGYLYRQLKDTPHRGAQHLGGERVRAAGGEKDAIHPKGRRRAQHRPQVSRVLEGLQQQVAPVTAYCNRLRSFVKLAEDTEHPLGGHGVRQLGLHAGGYPAEALRPAGIGGQAPGGPLPGLPGGQQLHRRVTGLQRLLGQFDPLGDEQALFFPLRPGGSQRRIPLDRGVLPGEDRSAG